MRYINPFHTYFNDDDPVEVMSLEEMKEYLDEEEDDYFSGFAYGPWNDEEWD